jgi:hypothetical protein
MSAAPDAYLSGAHLSGLLLRVPCERRRVEAEVARFGPLRLARDPDCPPDLHPVHFELWSVHDGALHFGAIDQHRLARRIGAAWGQAVGGLWGAMLAPWGGPRYERELPSRVAEWYAQAVSRATASSVGTYHEVMVSVPGVILMDDELSQEHAWVVGMMTDSALARWADVAFGFGYRKVLGRIERDPRGNWTVSTDSGRRLVSVIRHPTKRSPDVDVRRIDDALQKPLLGSPRPGRLARSPLRRSLAQPGAHVVPAAVSIEAAPTFMSALLPECLEVGPYTNDGSWGAIEFSDLEALVGYPSRA